MDTDRLKAGKSFMKDAENGNLCDLKGNNKDVHSLPSEMISGDGTRTMSECNRSVNVDDSANGNEQEVIDFDGTCNRSPRRIESWERDLDFYTDKSIMEYELPEPMVCYKESTDHAVKDICIDEGRHSHAMIFFGDAVEEGNGVHSFLAPCKDENKDLIKEERDNIVAIADDLKSSPDNDCSKDSYNEPGFMDMMWIGVENKYDTEMLADDGSRDKFLHENLLSGLELDTGFFYPESFDRIEDTANNPVTDKIVDDVSEQKSVPELGINGSHPEISHTNANGVDQELIQSSSVDTILASRTLVSSAAEVSNNSIDDLVLNPTPVSSAAAELNNSTHINDVCYSSKVESGNIASNFDSSHPEVSGREEYSQIGDSGHRDTQSISNFEDGNSDGQAVSHQEEQNHGEASFSAAGPLVSASISQDGNLGHLKTQNMSKGEDDFSESGTSLYKLQRGHGESSFSATSTLSGLISYSGPIAYSGSLSLRSDSSTTSTRSFAFPVLQSEWNRSPVRMAKADRRHFPKLRGWRQGLLCCRF